MPEEWRFLATLCSDPSIAWSHVAGLPRNVIERSLPRPNLGRYRAALSACLHARRNSRRAILVTHLPLMTAATAYLRRSLCPDVAQVAFSFNFTALPEGRRRAILAEAFRDVQEFVVYSQFERSLYSETLGIDRARLRFLPWAMERPEPGPTLPPGMPSGSFLCAIGGEARDYRLLADAMRVLPEQEMVVVARPYSVAGVNFPSNVTVFTNLSLEATWAIANASQGMAIPLQSNDSVCGHVTLVGAQLLGVPLVITDTKGVADYVRNEDTARLVPAGNVHALASALRRLVLEPQDSSEMAQRAQIEARRRSDPQIWVDYFIELANRHDGGTRPLSSQ